MACSDPQLASSEIAAQLAHPLLAGAQLRQFDRQQCPHIGLGGAQRIFESLDDAILHLLQLLDVDLVGIAEAGAGVGVQLAHAPRQRAALGWLLVIGGNLDGERLDDVRLGLRQIAKQVLQLGVLHFCQGMLIEMLTITGNLDQLVELVHALVHGSSCDFLTGHGDCLVASHTYRPQARCLRSIRRAVSRVRCANRATCKTFCRLMQSPNSAPAGYSRLSPLDFISTWQFADHLPTGALMDQTTDTGGRILLVDDEAAILRTFRYCLEDRGYTVLTAASAAQAEAILQRQVFDLCFLDLRLGEDNGLDVLQQMRVLAPWMRVVIVTAHSAVDTAVDAMQAGAADYLVKPCSPEQLRLSAAKQLEVRQMAARLEALEGEVQQRNDAIGSHSPAMMGVVETARQVADTDANILILGESGTG